MIAFCLVRVPVTIPLILGAKVGGLHSGLSASKAITALNDNLLIGSQVGMTFIMIGAFAVALARTGIVDHLCHNNAGGNLRQRRNDHPVGCMA